MRDTRETATGEVLGVWPAPPRSRRGVCVWCALCVAVHDERKLLSLVLELDA